MLPSNPIEIMDVYASNSQYINGPSPEQQAAGTVPLDTLPADWWNWLWKQITERINQASEGMEAIYDEVMSVLTAASIEPSQLQSDQLLNAIKALASVTGTAAVAGAVKSSTDSGKVSIDENGIMTVNGLGIPSSLNTTVKNIVGAINEILLNYTNNKATTDASIEGLQNGKAPTNHASEETTYGAGTASTYGHVKLSDSYNTETPKSANESVGASQKALYEAYAELKASSLVIPTGLIFPFAGPDTKVPTGYLLCNGQQVSKEDYAALYAVIGTTYNRPTDGEDSQLTVFRVPDLRECSPIGAGERGAGVSTHETYTLGQFKDDSFKDHNHPCSSTSNNHTHNFDISASHGHAIASLYVSRKWGTAVGARDANAGGVLFAGARDAPTNSAYLVGSEHFNPIIQPTSVNFSGETKGQNSNHNHSIGNVGGNTTHGKHLGMNYIIKT